ncbi:54S ribosomal protein L7, mitochondrial [Aspergillus udagawae]|uniref:54S ribosomal protein L7, mitochondrial n=1 Tax=Aspergillus udagawae TaxID=91492 RepID=A0ABQ0ZZW1_9EURO|nr:54S ribosomal protein L7, mitochondrial [Aspergillus udagawae]GFF70199.1 54S ribosomal protein L7, mitochondrial [Aspergillus udagawae]GFG03941.1 54S ribosomal protein L7, mitochondrial [Aspergillus udagawae]GFG21315.1 54S ribosomal protein L7, mitochondrial [Aspergillus udagawae]
MAASESSRFLARSLPRAFAPSSRLQSICWRRNASDQASSKSLIRDLESSSSLSASVSDDIVKSFDPVARSRVRKTQLPRSRYQFRSPKYDRGPLHPHRPPPPSDPSSRLFVPGPFSLPRVTQTWESTISPDILTLCYVHTPPGFKPPPKGSRLREWDDSSPYHKNRPLRGPRGGDVLRLLRKPITFNNIPQLERITIHSYVKQAATENSSWLHVAGMAVQAISNVRVQTFKSKASVATWGIAPGRDTVAVKAELRGEDMLHFFGKLVDVVLPRIKDWEGVKGTSGDSSGNITFGLEPENVALFPEIEVNYDMYPPKMIPGAHITIHTTARTDKDARLLLSAMGIPFYGKMVD